MKPLVTLAGVCWMLALLPGATSARANSKTPVSPKPVVSQPKSVTYQVYGSYFESKNSGLGGQSSYLVLPTQRAFDTHFGAAAVMGKNNFLPRDAFASQVVIAVIKRGAAITNYRVQSVETNAGTLSIRYKTSTSASTSGSATFASPLILTVPKSNFRSVVFIENGQRVGEVSRNLSAKTPQIKVYLVAFGDGGKRGRKFGCDDSLVPVTRALTLPQAPLKFALESLLSMPQRDAKNAGLENFWKGRDLRLKSVVLRNGVATIHISGEVFIAGICDQPRITEQIEATARQFASVKRVRVFIGNQSLASALS